MDSIEAVLIETENDTSSVIAEPNDFIPIKEEQEKMISTDKTQEQLEFIHVKELEKLDFILVKQEREELDFIPIKEEQQESDFIPFKKVKKESDQVTVKKEKNGNPSEGCSKTKRKPKPGAGTYGCRSLSPATRRAFYNVETGTLVKIETEQEGEVTFLYCPRCNQKMPGKVPFERHAWQEHLLAPLRCEYCRRRFLWPESLEQHTRDSHTLECIECEKFCENKRSYRIHTLQHAGVCIQCALCKSRFVNEHELEMHQTKHFPHTCIKCHGKFQTLEKLIEHAEIHMKDKLAPQIKCEYCEKRFQRSKSASKHAQNEHPQEFAANQPSEVQHLYFISTVV